MLKHCVPHELRFLGTVLTDATREHYENFVQGELNANRVNHFSGFKDAGVTHEVCEKLCSALAVVHADNRPVAETVFNLLDDQRVLKLCEETTDLKILEDYRLLYIMAVHHPALSFNQKLHLMYTYQQRLDAIFSEKSRCNFTGSFSSSAEVSERVSITCVSSLVSFSLCVHMYDKSWRERDLFIVLETLLLYL